VSPHQTIETSLEKDFNIEKKVYGDSPFDSEEITKKESATGISL
jgi:hypothetical protein